MKLVDIYVNIARWRRYLFNIGCKNKCPICGKWIKSFLPFGLHPRPNAQCPFCESLERHRSLWLFLSNRTYIFSGGISILHLAPEDCIKKRLLRLENVLYVTADLASTMVSVNMDIQFIPFQSSSFDCVLCYHVLEHVQNDHKAMQEIFRILKPGGWAVLQVPMDKNRKETLEDTNILFPEERERIFGQRDHLRIYGQNYKQRLVNAGFTVTFDSYIKKLPTNQILKYALEYEDIFLVSKPVNCQLKSL